MKFCPEINELCKHSVVKSGRPLYCVYGGILRKFEEMKECPEEKAGRKIPDKSDADLREESLRPE